MYLSNLNINYLSSKPNDLKAVVTSIFDILVITETKLDNTFPVSQLHIDGFSMPFRLEGNRNGISVTF